MTSRGICKVARMYLVIWQWPQRLSLIVNRIRSYNVSSEEGNRGEAFLAEVVVSVLEYLLRRSFKLDRYR